MAGTGEKKGIAEKVALPPEEWMIAALTATEDEPRRPVRCELRHPDGRVVKMDSYGLMAHVAGGVMGAIIAEIGSPHGRAGRPPSKDYVDRMVVRAALDEIQAGADPSVYSEAREKRQATEQDEVLYRRASDWLARRDSPLDVEAAVVFLRETVQECQALADETPEQP